MEKDIAATLKVGDAGELVERLQAALISFKHDLDLLGTDGKFGSHTKAAVESFQGSRGLAVPGVADPSTVAALDLDPDTLKGLIEIDKEDKPQDQETFDGTSRLDAAEDRPEPQLSFR